MYKHIVNFLIIAAVLYFVPKVKLPNESILLIALSSVIGFLLVEQLMGNRIEGLEPGHDFGDPVVNKILNDPAMNDAYMSGTIDLSNKDLTDAQLKLIIDEVGNDI